MKHYSWTIRLAVPVSRFDSAKTAVTLRSLNWCFGLDRNVTDKRNSPRFKPAFAPVFHSAGGKIRRSTS